MFMFKKTLEIPAAGEALPGRHTRSRPPAIISSTATRSRGRIREGLETAMFGMGCFWGAERKFWELGDGVYVTAVGYAGGSTPNPTYEEVCSGRTGHNEVVLVVFDPTKISYERLLKTFWESHDPTQGMRQGNDVGTQYRSGIYAFSPAQRAGGRGVEGDVRQGAAAEGLRRRSRPRSVDAPPFYFAEDYHQQYLAKNPFGYCGLGGTGVSCPIGTGVAAAQA